MATATGLTVIKKFNYRGDLTEEWSNKYWFTGTIPVDETTWLALFTAVTTTEKACYTPSSTIVRAYGYNDTASTADAVWVYNLEEEASPIPGTLVGQAGDAWMAGDQAGMVQWKTSRKTTRGKWVYLRKFFHDGLVDTGTRDEVAAVTFAAYQVHHLKMTDGTLPDGRTIRSTTQDETFQPGGGPSPWVTTRTLKRRSPKKKEEPTP